MNEKWRYENLRWPEINEAVERGLVPVLPVGTVEQHGPHLPIKMDLWTAHEIVSEAARRRPDSLLAMPTVPYGFTTHVMDFPGTITVHPETFTRYVTDVLESACYHGFKKLIMLNGHGSNIPPLELAARRVMLETDAIVSLTSWWPILTANQGFVDSWRESEAPGGTGHAGEAESSLGLHLDESLIEMGEAESHVTWTNRQKSKFEYVDLFHVGPVSISGWTSTFTEKGICGAAELATKEKGEVIFEEAVSNLIEWADEFHAREFPPRVDHHTRKPTTDVPG
jgi:creatinine amidohydrolase